NDSVIDRWVSGDPAITYRSLASEEHTAQIAKDIAAQIEEAFRGRSNIDEMSPTNKQVLAKDADAVIEEDFRSQGINVISSTTTFEMGINIGDLQKVL